MWTVRGKVSLEKYNPVVAEFRDWTIDNGIPVRFELEVADWMKNNSGNRDNQQKKGAKDHRNEQDKKVFILFSLVGKRNLKLTGKRSTVSIQHSYQYIQSSEIKCLHKKEGFDEAFRAMKVLKPLLTEQSFAGIVTDDNNNCISYDEDMVHLVDVGNTCVEYDEYDDSDWKCLGTIKLEEWELIPTRFTTEVCVCVSDLQSNMESLKTELLKIDEDIFAVDNQLHCYNLYLVVYRQKFSPSFVHLTTASSLYAAKQCAKRNSPPNCDFSSKIEEGKTLLHIGTRGDSLINSYNGLGHLGFVIEKAVIVD